MPLYLLFIALFLGTFWRGAYFPAGKAVFALLLLAAGALELLLGGGRRWRSPGLRLLALFGAWAAAGLFWSEAPLQTRRELLLLAGYLSAYLVVNGQLRAGAEEALNRIAAAWVYLATMVAAWAVAAYLFRLEPYATVLDGLLRAGSTFEYANALSCFALMSLPVTAALRRSVKAPDLPLLSVAFALQVAAVLLSLSRLGLAALALLLLVVLADSYRRGELLRLLLACGAGLVVALVALVLLTRGQPLPAAVLIAVILTALGWRERRAQGTGQGARLKLAAAVIGGAALGAVLVALALSEGARYLIVRRFWRGFAWEQLLPHRLDTYTGALDAWRAHPWRGSGLGAFAEVYQQYAIASYTKFAHNLPLQAAVETGLPGAATIGAFLLYVLIMSLRALLGGRGQQPLRQAFAMAALVFIAYNLIDWEWYVPALTGWFIVAVASLEPCSSRRLRGTAALAATGVRVF